jgi:hypothetical protein
MVRKKSEGDEKQRARAARAARRSGHSPSGEHVTTGASKQRTHLKGRKSLTHQEKLDTHEGKQQQRSPQARPGHRGRT